MVESVGQSAALAVAALGQNGSAGYMGSLVAVTFGARGAVRVGRSGIVHARGGVAHTVGVGDSFHADLLNFLYWNGHLTPEALGRVDALVMEEALEFANVTWSRVPSTTVLVLVTAFGRFGRGSAEPTGSRSVAGSPCLLLAHHSRPELSSPSSSL